MRGLKTIVLALVAMFSLPAIAGGLQASYGGVPDLCSNRFTRPTTVVEYCGERDGSGNLLDVKGSNAAVYSEELDNGAWAPTNMSVTPNAVHNPVNGALDADAFVEDDTAAAEHKVVDAIAITTGEYYVYSVFVRAANRNWGALYVSTENVGVYFDARNQQVGNGIGTLVANGLIVVDKEWSRAWFAFQATGTASRNTSIYIAEGNADVTFDGLDQTSLYYYGFQAEHKRSRADAARGPGPYIRTSTNDKPFFDLAPNSAPVNVCTGPQDQHGNGLCGQDFDGIDDEFTMAHDPAQDVLDGDHTLTIVMERNERGVTANRSPFDAGAYQVSGMFVQMNGTSGKVTAVYNKAGDAAIPEVTDIGFITNPHVIQVVRRDDIATIYVDGKTDLPANVAGYGIDGSEALEVSPASSARWDGNIFYVRLDEEALSPDELATELAALQGVATSRTEVSRADVITDGDMEAAGVGSWTQWRSAVYSKTTVTPHGGSKAIRVEYGGEVYPAIYQNVCTVGRTYRVTGFAKSDGNEAPTVRVNTLGTLWTGTTSTSWQGFDFTFTAAGSNVFLYSDADTNGEWSEFDDVHVYELDEQTATFSRSTTGTTESGGRLTTTPANVPRVGGDGGGILIEGQGTNYNDYAIDFSSWDASTRANVPSCTELAPDGTNTACVIHEDATAGNSHFIDNYGIGRAASAMTNSVYVKPLNRDWFYIYDNASGSRAYFNAATCNPGTVGGYDYISCENAQNGFCRCQATWTSAATANYTIRIGIADDDNSFTFNGLDQDSFVAWGWQTEPLSFASSLIPTDGAPATRTADSYTIDPHPEVGPRLLPEEFDGEGVLTVEFDAKCEFGSSADVGDTARYLVGINDATAAANNFEVYVSMTGRLYWNFKDSTDTAHTGYTAADVIDYSEWFKVKTSVDFSDLSTARMLVNGAAVALTCPACTGSATFNTGPTLIRLGQYRTGSVTSFCRIRNLRVEPREF